MSEPPSNAKCDTASTTDFENRVFYPASRTSVTVTKDKQIEVIPCPTHGLTSTCHSTDMCSSPAIPDSLNSSVTESAPLNRGLQGTTTKAFEESATPIMLKQSLEENEKLQIKEKGQEQPYYVCEEDSDSDSLEEHNSNKPPTFQPGISSQDFSSSNKQKVVGILKKSNRYSSVPFTNHYNRPRYNSLLQETPCSSNEAFDKNQLGYGNSSKLQKRVRFSDQVDVHETNSPMVMNITDSVQIELWKRVFPKEFSQQSVPNSAFTPKMKCSLSSNPTSSQGIPRTLKRSSLPSNVSIHVPMAATEEYASPTKSRTTTGVEYPSAHNEYGNHNIEVKDLTDSVDGSSEASLNEQTVLKSLDKTPTDAEINSMWDQIRQCLQDGRKVPVPPRVFNFKPPTENGRRTLTNNYRTVTPCSDSSLGNNKTYNSTQSSSMQKNNMNYTTRKQLVYRQPNQSRLMRSRNDTQFHPVEVATHNAIPVKQESLFKSRLHSGIQSSSKEPTKCSSSSKGGYYFMCTCRVWYN